MKPEKASVLNTGSAKVLNAPVHLASMAANLENNIEDIKSIWVMSRDDGLVSHYYFLCSVMDAIERTLHLYKVVVFYNNYVFIEHLLCLSFFIQ
jgi:hypothetical protein